MLPFNPMSLIDDLKPLLDEHTQEAQKAEKRWKELREKWLEVRRSVILPPLQQAVQLIADNNPLGLEASADLGKEDEVALYVRYQTATKVEYFLRFDLDASFEIVCSSSFDETHPQPRMHGLDSVDTADIDGRIVDFFKRFLLHRSAYDGRGIREFTR